MIEDVQSGWPAFINFQELTAMHTKISKEPTILRRPQVQQRTGLSRSTLYQAHWSVRERLSSCLEASTRRFP